MKSTLSQLEQAGIRPTRDHVKTQLDNIKTLTLGGLYTYIKTTCN
jgi:hypothetical protein